VVVILAGEMNFIEDESRGTAASKTTPTWPVLTVSAAQPTSDTQTVARWRWFSAAPWWTVLRDL